MIITLLDSLNIPEKHLQRLLSPLRAQGHTINIVASLPASIQELKEKCKAAEILVIADKPLPDEVIETMPNLKMISVAFTGIDHVGHAHLQQRGITVCNAAGYSDISVSELVIALTLNLHRHVCTANDTVRHGGSHLSLPGSELSGKVVGIVGTGRIGLKTASLFKAFGCRLLGFNHSVKKEGVSLGIDYVSLDELLTYSDVVSLHLPLKTNTRGILSKDRLSLMKPSAFLINCGRGPLVDNTALADALNNGKIAGAGIDVYDMEPPLPPEYPLLRAKNTLLTPHLAYATKESMLRRAEIAIENAEKFITRKPQNVLI